MEILIKNNINLQRLTFSSNLKFCMENINISWSNEKEEKYI